MWPPNTNLGPCLSKTPDYNFAVINSYNKPILFALNCYIAIVHLAMVVSTQNHDVCAGQRSNLHCRYWRRMVRFDVGFAIAFYETNRLQP
jgi:hypothetical protein